MDEEAQVAARAFGLSVERDAQSLCPYGPVYRFEKDGRAWVLKRTGFPNSSAAALRDRLRALAWAGVNVVSPAEAFEPNPRAVEGVKGDWVVYPFIEGRAYVGRPEQIEAAGELLGRVHAAGATLGMDMRCVSHLPVHDADWFRIEAGRALNVVGGVLPDEASDFETFLRERSAFHERATASLAGVDLPLAACSWDFKASNLVYTEERGPVLVDPDHGGRIPRLFDLACSALLFNSDSATAPDAMFDRDEWERFLKDYQKSVAFTEAERRHWQDVLLAAWMDQGLWLLGNWPEGWEDPRTRAYLTDLALNDLTAFALSSG